MVNQDFINNYISNITDTKQLKLIIEESKSDKFGCDDHDVKIDDDPTYRNQHFCFSTVVKSSVSDDNTISCNYSDSRPQCPAGLVKILITILSCKPKLFDDDGTILKAIENYYISNDIKAKGLVTKENLITLNETSNTQTITWIKYEKLLVHLLKTQVYEPKTLVNEVFTLVKDELNHNISIKFSSIMETCVKYCRENDEEDEEKLCEIMDWMSWFIAAEDDDFR